MDKSASAPPAYDDIYVSDDVSTSASPSHPIPTSPPHQPTSPSTDPVTSFPSHISPDFDIIEAFNRDPSSPFSNSTPTPRSPGQPNDKLDQPAPRYKRTQQLTPQDLDTLCLPPPSPAVIRLHQPPYPALTLFFYPNIADAFKQWEKGFYIFLAFPNMFLVWIWHQLCIITQLATRGTPHHSQVPLFLLANIYNEQVRLNFILSLETSNRITVEKGIAGLPKVVGRKYASVEDAPTATTTTTTAATTTNTSHTSSYPQLKPVLRSSNIVNFDDFTAVDDDTYTQPPNDLPDEKTGPSVPDSSTPSSPSVFARSHANWDSSALLAEPRTTSQPDADQPVVMYAKSTSPIDDLAMNRIERLLNDGIEKLEFNMWDHHALSVPLPQNATQKNLLKLYSPNRIKNSTSNDDASPQQIIKTDRDGCEAFMGKHEYASSKERLEFEKLDYLPSLPYLSTDNRLSKCVALLPFDVLKMWKEDDAIYATWSLMFVRYITLLALTFTGIGSYPIDPHTGRPDLDATLECGIGTIALVTLVLSVPAIMIFVLQNSTFALPIEKEIASLSSRTQTTVNAPPFTWQHQSDKDLFQRRTKLMALRNTMSLSTKNMAIFFPFALFINLYFSIWFVNLVQSSTYFRTVFLLILGIIALNFAGYPPRRCKDYQHHVAVVQNYLDTVVLEQH